MNPREIAADFHRRGWSPIPVKYRSKAPVNKNWPSLQTDAASIPTLFAVSDQNVGVRLGDASGGLVDIDLDSREALEFATEILPQTATFGRAAKLKSHWLYVARGLGSLQFKDPVAKQNGHNEMLLEVRSTGLQTVFPGSVHESGESITWDNDCEPTSLRESELIQRARFLAAMALLYRYWPAEGGRHDAALAITGLLVRAGVAPDSVANFVTAVNGGESFDKHLKLAGAAAIRLERDAPVQGIPTVRKLFGDAVTNQILMWLGIAAPTPSLSDVADAVAALTADSLPDEVDAVLALLRSAAVTDLQSEETFKEIKRHTGMSIRALRKQYRSTRTKSSRLPGQAKQLVEIGERAELFEDTETGDAFATVQRDGHAEHLRIESQAFRRWLGRSLYEMAGVVPDGSAMGNAVSVLSGLAAVSGIRHKVWLRVARDDEAIYVDLGDATWRSVRITRTGWEVVSDPPIRFRRTDAHALPEPERDGTIELLRPFVNTDDQGFMLIVGVVVNAFRPDKPFPILQLAGDKGSAKSTLLTLLRLLIDPAPAPGAGLPPSETDLVVVAHNCWLVSGDNVSHLRADLADALCRLSTGGGLRRRKLYTDSDNIAIDVRRPVMITGLSSVTEREDFLDRVVLVTLQRIEGNRRTEESIQREFNLVRARILGALFDGVASGLRNTSSISFQELPRMADFVVFASAAGSAYGWAADDFLAAYDAMRAVVFEEAAMGDPVVKVISDWMDSQMDAYPGFEGTPGELLEQLEKYCETKNPSLLRSRYWPKAASALVRKLRAVRTGLEQLALRTLVTRDNDNRSRVFIGYIGPRTNRPPEDDMPF